MSEDLFATEHEENAQVFEPDLESLQDLSTRARPVKKRTPPITSSPPPEEETQGTQDSQEEESSGFVSTRAGHAGRRAPLLLTREQEEDLVDWLKDHPIFYNKKLSAYKDTEQRNRLLEMKAKQLRIYSKFFFFSFFTSCWCLYVIFSVHKVNQKRPLFCFYFLYLFIYLVIYLFTYIFIYLFIYLLFIKFATRFSWCGCMSDLLVNISHCTCKRSNVSYSSEYIIKKKKNNNK